MRKPECTPEAGEAALRVRCGHEDGGGSDAEEERGGEGDGPVSEHLGPGGLGADGWEGEGGFNGKEGGGGLDGKEGAGVVGDGLEGGREILFWSCCVPRQRIVHG